MQVEKGKTVLAEGPSEAVKETAMAEVPITSVGGFMSDARSYQPATTNLVP